VKERTLIRYARINTWLVRRERQAFNRMSRAYTDADFRRHQRWYERLFDLRHRMIECAISKGIIPAHWRSV
jgi:hypothetical protein